MPKTARAFIGNGEVGHYFKFNPNSAMWGYRENTQSFDTLGGRVVQLLSIEVTQATIQGDAGSRSELQRLGKNALRIMAWQIRHQRSVFLRVPSRGWNMRVYVADLPAIGWNLETIKYPWTLRLEVEEDLGVFTKKILRNELKRLAQNIGYDPKWHGGDVDHLQRLWSKAKADYGTGASTGTIYKGSKDEIAEELENGFFDAKRPDLQRMVKTDDFDVWIEKESGWNPSIVGPGLGGTKVTGGLPQFMYFSERTWLVPFFKQGAQVGNGNHFTMTPYQQAKAICQYFNLTAAEIRGYAAQIRAGTYRGWG